MRTNKILIFMFFIPTLFYSCNNNVDNRIPELPENLESSMIVTQQINYLKDIIKENPENAVAYYRLAKLYSTVDDVENAYISVKIAIFLQKDNIQFGLFLIKCYIQKGLYIDAYELLERLKSKIPSQEYSKLALIIYMQTGKYAEANVIIDEKLAQYPNEIYYITKKAEIISALNDTTKAIEMYEKALSFDTNSSITLIELAKLYNYKKEYLKSQKVSKKAIKMDSNNVEANFNYAYAFKNLGNKDSALYYYKKVLTKDSLHTKSRYNSAIIYLQKNNYPEAEKHLKTLFKQNQNLPNLNFKLAFILQKQQKFEESLTYYSKIDSLDVNYNLAQKAVNQIKFAKQKSVN